MQLTVLILIVLFCAAISFYRLLSGPHVLDRIAAINAIGIMLLTVLVILGSLYGRALFIDVALVYGVLLFVDVLVMAKYFGSTDKSEEGNQ